MPPKFRIASIGVYVKDRARSAKWYKQKLGMNILADDDEHWTTVGYPKGVQIHLCEPDDGKIPKWEKGNSGILLTVKGDLKRAAASLKRRGVKFTQPPVERPWGWISMFADPDGNEYWLVPE